MDELKCPFCGAKMDLHRHRFIRGPEHAGPVYCWYCCTNGECLATAGFAESEEGALTAARKRPMQRPLTLEEMLGSRVVWLEDVDKAEVIPAIVDGWDNKGVWYVLDRDRRMYVRRSDYQKRWRAWEKKPTDEERAAAE